MTLACFFRTCRDGHFSHTFGYCQFDLDQGGLIIALLTVYQLGGHCWRVRGRSKIQLWSRSKYSRAAAVLGGRVGQLSWCRASVLGYVFFTEDVSSLLISGVAILHRSWSGPLMSIVDRDVMWLPGIKYDLMERLCAEWRAAIGWLTDAPADFEAPSVDVLEMNDSVMLFEKDAGWTQAVSSVNHRLVKLWGWHRGKFAPVKLSATYFP